VGRQPSGHRCQAHSIFDIIDKFLTGEHLASSRHFGQAIKGRDSLWQNLEQEAVEIGSSIHRVGHLQGVNILGQFMVKMGVLEPASGTAKNPVREHLSTAVFSASMGHDR